MRDRQDVFRKVERTLFDYPLLAKRLAVREQYLIARCNVSEGYIRANGQHTGMAIEERVMLAKEKDVEYQTLQLKMTAVKRAYEVLPDELKQLVELYYFKKRSRQTVASELAISERSFYRLRNRAIEMCAQVIGAEVLNAISVK